MVVKCRKFDLYGVHLFLLPICQEGVGWCMCGSWGGGGGECLKCAAVLKGIFTLKGKNLFLDEQTLFFKRRSPLIKEAN